MIIALRCSGVEAIRVDYSVLYRLWDTIISPDTMPATLWGSARLGI